MNWRGGELSPSQRKALDSLVKYGNLEHGIKGRSAHGGLVTTRTSLVRNGYIDPHNYQITDKGLEALNGSMNPVAVERERCAKLAETFASGQAYAATLLPENSADRAKCLDRAWMAEQIAAGIRETR